MPVRIGVVCPSEIAFRRFMPALAHDKRFKFAGIAHASLDEWNGADIALIEKEYHKAQKFIEEYGGEIFDSYSKLVEESSIDAVYLPLPPALHGEWTKKAIKAGKHCFVEKPFATELSDTLALISAARENKLVLNENYMFVYHSQLDFIRNEIADKKMGDIRCINISFGFPFRGSNDFRYNTKLGGGALMDCGGYALKLAQMLAGGNAEVSFAQMKYKDGIDADIFGSAVISGENTAHIEFGMDNSYKCSLEIWGSERSLLADRIFTAPAGFHPTVTYRDNNGEEVIHLSADDTFSKSLDNFMLCITDDNKRLQNYEAIQRQAELVEQFKKKASEL